MYPAKLYQQNGECASKKCLKTTTLLCTLQRRLAVNWPFCNNLLFGARSITFLPQKTTQEIYIFIWDQTETTSSKGSPKTTAPEWPAQKNVWMGERTRKVGVKTPIDSLIHLTCMSWIVGGTRVTEGNWCRHRENMLTPHRKPQLDDFLWPSSSEVGDVICQINTIVVILLQSECVFRVFRVFQITSFPTIYRIKTDSKIVHILLGHTSNFLTYTAWLSDATSTSGLILTYRKSFWLSPNTGG